MMTPHRDAGKGTFLLDRMCGKLGRVKLASGTTDVEEFKALNAFISKLKKDRRWDLLALLAQGAVTPLELLDARDRGELHALPSADELRSLPRAIEAWLTIADIGPRTRADYTALLVYPVGTKVLALPERLKQDRVAALVSGKRQMFNNRLTAARSFVRDTFGVEHKLMKALPAPLDVTHREGNPQEPDQIRALALRIPYPDELWALVLTGMRQSEYWGTWEVLSDRVKVAGAKGRRGEPLPRVVPLVYRPARPRIVYSTFYKALVRDSDETLNVHDLRKTAQRWWEDAGVPDWRISLYAGHARGRHQLATIYRKPRDLTRLLVEDAERVRAWLGDPPQLSLRAVSA
jgi:hypothetical protein